MMQMQFDDDWQNENDDKSRPVGFELYDWQKDEIREIIELVRGELVHPGLRPVEIKTLAKLMLALSRLPRPTPDIEIEFSISVDLDKGGADQTMQRDTLVYYGLELSPESVRLDHGGYIVTPNVGGDSYSATDFEMEVNGFREDARGTGIRSWLEGISVWVGGEHHHELEIADYGSSDDNTPWEDDGAETEEE